MKIFYIKGVRIQIFFVKKKGNVCSYQIINMYMINIFIVIWNMAIIYIWCENPEFFPTNKKANMYLYQIRNIYLINICMNGYSMHALF